MTANPHPDLTVVGFKVEAGAVHVVTSDGRQFVCRSPAELWSDLRAIGDKSGGRALPGATTEPPPPRRTHRVVAEPMPAAEPSGNDQLIQAATDAADIAEEAAAQEWGAIGRMGAQLIRTHGPTIARNFSPRHRKRRGRSR